MSIKYYKYSNKGPRLKNEDSIKVEFSDSIMWAGIADGVGGAVGGEFASSKALELVFDGWRINHDLRQSIIDANDEIKEIQKIVPEYRNMATTFTGCYVEDDLLYGGHVGDSKLCILRGNGIKQLTYSHTEFNRLYQLGLLTMQERDTYPRRNVLESALGINGPLVVQDFSFRIQKGDRVLMTTDGVHEIIKKIEFRDLNKKYDDVDDFGEAIVSVLLKRDLVDNASFVLLSI